MAFEPDASDEELRATFEREAGRIAAEAVRSCAKHEKRSAGNAPLSNY
jgi:hypothetical protein